MLSFILSTNFNYRTRYLVGFKSAIKKTFRRSIQIHCNICSMVFSDIGHFEYLITTQRQHQSKIYILNAFLQIILYQTRGMTFGSIRIPLWGHGHFGHYERSKRKIIISLFSQVFISHMCLFILNALNSILTSLQSNQFVKAL